MATYGEICKLCFQPVRVGFHVPDEIWKETPCTDRANVMCLGCFTRLADEAFLPWDKCIEFHPVSRVTDTRLRGYQPAAG